MRPALQMELKEPFEVLFDTCLLRATGVFRHFKVLQQAAFLT